MPKKAGRAAAPKKRKSATSAGPRLTARQQLFVDAYLVLWNATQAAIQAGYSAKTARVIGSENLTKPAIKAEIDRRLKEKAMGADEVLARLADIARASVRDFYDIVTVEKDGAPVLGTDGKPVQLAVPNMVKILQSPVAHLVKEVGHDQWGQVELKIHDSFAALVQLGRHHKLFTDRLKLADWRDEATDAGINPDDLKKQLVEAAVAQALRSSGGSTS
jgi:phage terminase small subunit